MSACYRSNLEFELDQRGGSPCLSLPTSIQHKKKCTCKFLLLICLTVFRAVKYLRSDVQSKNVFINYSICCFSVYNQTYEVNDIGDVLCIKTLIRCTILTQLLMLFYTCIRFLLCHL